MVHHMSDLSASPNSASPNSAATDTPAYVQAPRWFKRVSGWGLAVLKPILPEKILHWLEHAAWFITVGSANTLLAYLIFVALLNWGGLDRTLALLGAYALGMVISYHSFGRLVFGHGQRMAWAKFGVSQFTLYLANKLLLDLMVWASGFSEELSQFLLLPVVALISYLLNRFFVFRRKKA